jgi:hypothetical protein
MKRSESILESIADTLIFEPTKEQKKLKAVFYAIYNDNPMTSEGDITPDVVKRVTGSKQIHSYWKDDTFRSWFLNEREYVQRAEYLFTRALDELEDILELGNNEEDPSERDRIKARMAPTKLQAIKLMFEITNRIPKGNDGKLDAIEVQKLVGAMLSGVDTSKLKALSAGVKDDKE